MAIKSTRHLILRQDYSADFDYLMRYIVPPRPAARTATSKSRAFKMHWNRRNYQSYVSASFRSLLAFFLLRHLSHGFLWYPVPRVYLFLFLFLLCLACSIYRVWDMANRHWCFMLVLFSFFSAPPRVDSSLRLSDIACLALQQKGQRFFSFSYLVLD